MRQIENEMLQAIEEKRNFNKSNTMVKHENNTVYVYLFGNLIATKKDNDSWVYDTCGWNTATTRSRLNALGANCCIKNGIIIFN